jgi:type IV pilus assembly protein PilB
MIDSLKALQNRRCRLGEQLISDGLINEQQLRQGLEHQRHTGAFLGETLVTLGYVAPADLGRYLEASTGFPFVNLAEYPLNTHLAHLIPEYVARRKRVLPIDEQGDTLHLAMADPLDLATLDDLRARLNRRIIPFLALEADLNEAINRVYDVRHKAQSVLEEITELPPTEQDLSVDELVGLAEDAPIVRLVNTMVQSALDLGASDIHIEPQEPCVRVRFRLDGLLYDQMTIPTYHQAAVVSRIKIMSRLNIAERRRPQDGRFSVKDTAGKEYDLRVSIMPTIYGEKVVLRILEKTSSFAVLEKLGFWSEQLRLFESFIRRPHGIVLVTGPTGSGKSTTLYAALHRINDSTLNINTIEDPVEYHLKGVNQVQVNPKIGVTFASGLRTLVRQDPDVIMVGEIRDLETAEIAIQAALTGHLVLSTLHTNDAPGALVRLQHMGVEPFLISSAVIGVVGQRLVRTVCPHCKETRPASSAAVAAFGLTPWANQTPVFAEGRGCGRCSGLGMKGRTGVFEVMPMSDTLREMVLQRASSATLRGQALAEGMMRMRDAALLKVLEGITTPEEVARVIYVEE